MAGEPKKTLKDYFQAAATEEQRDAKHREAVVKRAEYDTHRRNNPSMRDDAVYAESQRLKKEAQQAEKEYAALSTQVNAKNNLLDRLNSSINKLKNSTKGAGEAVDSTSGMLKAEKERIAQEKHATNFDRVPSRSAKAAIEREAANNIYAEHDVKKVLDKIVGDADKSTGKKGKEVGGFTKSHNWNAVRDLESGPIGKAAINIERFARDFGNKTLDTGATIVKRYGVSHGLPIAAAAGLGAVGLHFLNKNRQQNQPQTPDKQPPQRFGEVLSTRMFMSCPSVDSVHIDKAISGKRKKKKAMTSAAPVINNYPDVKPETRTYSEEMLEAVVQLSWIDKAKEIYKKIKSIPYTKKDPSIAEKYYHAVMLPLAPVSAALAIKTNLDLNKTLKQQHKDDHHKLAEDSEDLARQRLRRYRRNNNKRKRTNEFVAIEGATGAALYSLLHGMNKAKEADKTKQEAKAQRNRDHVQGVIASRLDNRR